jgi:hypothetical protein
MDTSTPSKRVQSYRDVVLMFLAFLDPVTHRIPVPRTPVRDNGYGGQSLEVFSRCRKRRAQGRIKLLPLWPCARLLLALYVDIGTGKRCRSWRSDRSIVEILRRSGLGCYSLAHVRRCRKLLEDLGLIRSLYVPPHYVGACRADGPCKGGHFPAKDAPDVDGGGKRASKGGKVIEVHVAGILGEADLWEPPPRQTGWQDAREAREAARELALTWTEGENPMPRPSAATMARDLAQVFASPAADLRSADLPSAESSPPAGGCTVEQSVSMDDHGRVIMDADSCDRSPSEKFKTGHGRASAARRDAQPAAAERPADAGRPCGPGCDAAAPAARASLDDLLPNGTPRRAQETERPKGIEEQAARHGCAEQRHVPRELPTAGPRRAGVVLAPFTVEAPIAPKDLARLRELFPALDWSAPAGRLERNPTATASSSSAAAARPPERAPSLFGAADLRPVGRHGERPRGWRGPDGGGS